MSSQIQCLQVVVEECPQQKSLVENLLSFFIEPEYYRTCSVTLPGNGLRSTIMGSAWGSNFTGFAPTSGTTLMVCTQKLKTCQNSFNNTFTSHMALYNISGLYNGQTASLCVQSFQECSSPFNSTFFPGLHTANLTAICR
ncbi:unnamed protein product [Candidula unifasciata]|uniref:Uncharacterized protein n=1 Tax=Candidula unifasciata TaxID=100452 RepID=A0A8S3ZSQ7_9EUPU|nr:unnamed protein product [Candidula unifasciata]